MLQPVNVEFLLDMKGDATGCFDSATYPSEVQVAVSLNKNFKPMNSPGDVLGARQTVLSNGAPEVLGPDGSWQAALDAIGGPNIAARKYADLRAAGAKNPELAANPTVKFSGYAIEMRVPFNTGGTGIPNFAPDHNMGFGMWWRDVDNGDVDPSSDPFRGQLDESWATWMQCTTVDCNADPKTSLYNTANWGQLIFDTKNPLGQ